MTQNSTQNQPLHSQTVKHFASDNYSGVHPKIMQALHDANGGHLAAYGDDIYTDKLQTLIRAQFGEQAIGFPVFNGTGANVLGIQSLMPRWGSVICTEAAHINQDESNAPQSVGGFKLWTNKTTDGKLTCELIESQAYGFGNEHRSQPSVVYISQATECGTCYSIDEIGALAETTHRYGMKLFVDGARLSNAAVHLDTDFYQMISKTGVDMVSLGGTKNGLMFGECLVSLRGDAADTMKFLRKMNMQTASKMRFISAQLIALLEDDFYKGLAAHSNAMAQLLASELAKMDGVQIRYLVQANGVFVNLPEHIIETVRAQYHFYDWKEGAVRLMCSFDTDERDVMGFVAAVKAALGQ